MPVRFSCVPGEAERYLPHACQGDELKGVEPRDPEFWFGKRDGHFTIEYINLVRDAIEGSMPNTNRLANIISTTGEDERHETISTQSQRVERTTFGLSDCLERVFLDL